MSKLNMPLFMMNIPTSYSTDIKNNVWMDEYDDNEIIPLEGAFYAASSYEKLFFSHFREEDLQLISSVPASDEEIENFILKDNNLVSIKYTPEYETNSAIDTPTNSIITSLFSFSRILTILSRRSPIMERSPPCFHHSSHQFSRIRKSL